ncbi:MAG: hypothetical protein D6704_08045 [Nitrospirae bacterium]|nr:MAG: hypothetical protein D6704_08045 [Nitrospirota bacterium]
MAEHLLSLILRSFGDKQTSPLFNFFSHLDVTFHRPVVSDRVGVIIVAHLLAWQAEMIPCNLPQQE